MKKNNATPLNLAKLVFNKIKGLKSNSKLPTEKILNSLFEILFYASLKTEESDFIKVTITLINSENSEQVLISNITEDRWSVIKFKEPIPYNVDSIVKLSKAADPWSSSFAVDFNNKGELFIWGLIDQSVHYQNFLHYESDTSHEQPGIFQSSITGIGTILVILEYDLIATLKQNILISKYVDVLKYGEISEKIKSHSKILKEHFENDLINYPKEKKEIWNKKIDNLWTQTLSRIMIRIQNYKHGGSFIITSQENSNLDIKHAIKYDRIYNALKKYLKYSLSYNTYAKIITNEYVGDDDDDAQIPYDLYLDEYISKESKEQTNNELSGAIRFVASLTCIDGLVVLDNNLEVKGFGAVVKTMRLPDLIHISRSAKINESYFETINPNHYGTRHRAIFTYCWENEGSLGFVISQDGEIRAITKVGEKLIMWENIKVHHLIKSTKLDISTINDRRTNK